MAIFLVGFGVFVSMFSLWLLPVSQGLFAAAYYSYRRKLFQNPATTPRNISASQLP